MDKIENISENNEELDALEAHLAGTLRPVKPSRDLIVRLRGRLRMPQRSEIIIRLRDWRSLFLAFGGVMSALLVLITVARALYYLFGRREG
ncbi:MAG TPA: hypothetical protein VGJ22_03865 [Anaerolineales bacterium]|jgi:hypothetical protein